MVMSVAYFSVFSIDAWIVVAVLSIVLLDSIICLRALSILSNGPEIYSISPSRLLMMCWVVAYAWLSKSNLRQVLESAWSHSLKEHPLRQR